MMSVQFGKCNFDGKTIDSRDLDEVRPLLALAGPDGEWSICKGNFAVLYRAFYTTKESRRENQPHTCKSGAIITWDGRLDNRDALIEKLGDKLSQNSTDVEMVAAGYERWGNNAFRELVGDWAITVWNPKDQSLVLAKDFVGTRHLYYSIYKDQVTWCTIIDPLVLNGGHPFKLEEEFIAGWLSFFPATHLTPYVGIYAVSPSCFVRLSPGSQKVTKYWDFDPARRIRYARNGEYEEHFRSLFAESVRRRLRSDLPILAELSGGMDSSAVVCMADLLIEKGDSDTPRVDTVSYYDDSEPNWNEKPYFRLIEQKRGRIGYHIDASSSDSAEFTDQHHFASTPGCFAVAQKLLQQLTDGLKTTGTRVILSGIGGDEVTGGVPTPLPELADLFARARFGTLITQLKTWALVKRKPLIQILFDLMREFLPFRLLGMDVPFRPPEWLEESFIKREQTALSGYRRRLRISRSLPSFQLNMDTTNLLRRQIASDPLRPEHQFEYRYPFLDRDLLEFMFAIPRIQIIKPGERRSLMRRSMVGIVPDEVLNRKRKAFVSRSPMLKVLRERSRLLSRDSEMKIAAFHFIDEDAFRSALNANSRGLETNIVAILRTLLLEYWLRHAESYAVLHGPSRLASRNKMFSTVDSREVRKAFN
jgi:asparagine synthase (glutamine-hydrolysing)